MNVSQQHNAQLVSGLEQLDCPSTIAEQLLRYLQLLQRWNKTYNLTALRDINDMITRHILDSLAIHPWLYGESLLDVGSGAGLPGIPLALLRPDMKICLLDSNGKKTRFLMQMKAELKLGNVIIAHSRIEQHQHRYDTIVSRAFASLADFIRLAGPCCTVDGRLLALKGYLPTDELKMLPSNYNVRAVYKINVPRLDAERHLVHVEAQ